MASHLRVCVCVCKVVNRMYARGGTYTVFMLGCINIVIVVLILSAFSNCVAKCRRYASNYFEPYSVSVCECVHAKNKINF